MIFTDKKLPDTFANKTAKQIAEKEKTSLRKSIKIGFCKLKTKHTFIQLPLKFGQKEVT